MGVVTLHIDNFYARARGSRHQGEYILVVVIVLFFCHLLKSSTGWGHEIFAFAHMFVN